MKQQVRFFAKISLKRALIFSRIEIHAFFTSNTFISNARLNFAKSQAEARQHPEVELLLFENYSPSSSTLLSKNNRKYSKKCTKTMSVC